MALSSMVLDDYNQTNIFYVVDKGSDMSVYEQPKIFPITALAKNVKAVKEAAQDSVVQITENGYGAYVFTSMQAFQDLIKREREDAAYEQYLLEEIGKGVDDLRAGRYTTSRKDMFARAVEIRKERNGGSDA